MYQYKKCDSLILSRILIPKLARIIVISKITEYSTPVCKADIIHLFSI